MLLAKDHSLISRKFVVFDMDGEVDGPLISEWVDRIRCEG